MKEVREPAMIATHAGEAPRPAKTESEARRLLKARLREVAVHRSGLRPFQGPRQERLGFEDLLKALENDYKVRGLRSYASLRSHLAHVRSYFGADKALSVTTERLRDYIVAKKAEGLSAASIQRQLEAVRRAFALGAQTNSLTFTPVVPTVRLANARQGFLSRADFEAILRNTRDPDLRDFVEWAFWTGMRKGEIAKLTWPAFDRETWTLRLHAKDAKSGHGRILALEGPLREIMERRVRARRLDCVLVFHRAGDAVAEFRKAWSTAAKRAGLTGVLFHDLRRSAIRNMIRGGVDPGVAMKISGHRTRSVFDRYNIVSEDDLRDAVRKTADYVSTLPKDLEQDARPAPAKAKG
jgi:integrase